MFEIIAGELLIPKLATQQDMFRWTTIQYLFTLILFQSSTATSDTTLILDKPASFPNGQVSTMHSTGH